MTETATTPIDRLALPAVVDLDDELARLPHVAGAKAAALAFARVHGLPALPGFVVTTHATRRLVDGRATRDHAVALHGTWAQLSDRGGRSLVVRSSSTSEDGASSSMAGLYRTVLDVRGWEAFVTAVDEVVDSGGEAPIAVLVQPFLEPAWGGVMFGADPVTGRADRLLVAAVAGGPDRLVSGEVDGMQLTLTGRGRLVEAGDQAPTELLRRRWRRRLARLAARTATTFGGPQDVEWAIDDAGDLVLLQSRPITALGDEARAGGIVLGPGPVAETFGTPLRPLEEDLWVPPLRDGLREALRLTGANSPRRLRTSPVVVSVGGRVAVDLDLLGLSGRRRSILHRLDPRPPARRLNAAWRVGRLRMALPALADDLVATVDEDLRSIPDLDELTPAELLRLLRRSDRTLVALHGHEVLAGLLLDDRPDQPTAASAALRLLAELRRSGDLRPDAELVAAHPVLLSLLAPGIGVDHVLPPPPASVPAAPPPAGAEAAVRESLRLRARWVHELTARAAMVLGRRLVADGVLTAPEHVARLRLEELAAVAAGDRAAAVELGDAVAVPPLPAAFRLTDDGVVVPLRPSSKGGARAAGGGRGSGPVHLGTATLPRPGDVLVVRTLDPALAGALPGLGGLVAETGSVLSHLAILAREYGVPTVVGLAGATERFAPGAWVVVDGATGEVSIVAAHEEGAA